MKVILCVSAATVAVGAAYLAANFEEFRARYIYSTLEPQWQKNDYRESLRQYSQALRDGRMAFADDLSARICRVAYRKPTLEAAHAVRGLEQSLPQDELRKTDEDRWRERVFRVLRFMPLEDWKKPSAITLLEEVVANDKTGSPAGMAAALVHWLRWESKVHNFSLQTLVLDHVDALCSGKPFPKDTFTDLLGGWGQPGIVFEKWTMGQVIPASHVARMVYEHGVDSTESPSAIYSTEVGRAGLIASALLADIPHNQQNEEFQQRLLRDPRAQTEFVAIPVTIQIAEESFFNERNEHAFTLLRDAEKGCDRMIAEHPMMGATYYAPIGDGYLCLGKRDDAMRAFRKEVQAQLKYDQQGAGGDYGRGRMWFALAHAQHMLGDDAAAFSAMNQAEATFTRYGQIRNALRSPFDLWMHVTDVEHDAFNGTSGDLRSKISTEMARAAFHAFGGRFCSSAQELRHVSLMLSPQKGCAVLARAGQIAATVGNFDILGEECLQQAIDRAKSGDVKMQSCLTLAQLYARKQRFQQALQLVRDAAKEASEKKDQWRISKCRLSVAYDARDWNEVCAAHEEMIQLHANKVDYQPLQEEWVRTWDEVCAYALRQLGNDAEADRIIRRIELRKYGKNIAD